MAAIRALRAPATASSERRYPQGIWGYPEQPVGSRILSQSADQSAGQARTGTGAVRSRDCLDASDGKSLGRSRTHNGVISASGGAVIMSAGRAPRIASASIPASPAGLAGPGRRPR
jgi:hypothetical protein